MITKSKAILKAKFPKLEKPMNKKEDEKEIQIIEKIIESKELLPQDVFGKLSRPQIDLLKRTIAKGASDDELKIFIQVCKGAQLNPFLRQVFLIPRWDNREGKETRIIQVSIDGLRSIAESSGAYAGNDDPIFEGENLIKIPDGKGLREIKTPEKATTTIYKIVNDQRYGFTATARWNEYYPGNKMGFQWQIRPFLMLGKCAEALALRKAFPKSLSGMYEEGELANSNIPQTIKFAATEKQKIATREELISKATEKELKGYKEKIIEAGPEKYSQEEKEKLLKLIENREVELLKQM